MTIRKKAFLIIVCIVLLRFGAAFLVFRPMVDEKFRKIEVSEITSDMERVHESLRDMLDHFEKKARDWASWDATYKFVDDRNEEYIAANINSSVFRNLDIDFALFINEVGQTVYAKAYREDVEVGAPLFLTKEFPLLLEPTTHTVRLTGFLRTSRGIIVVTSLSILDGEERGRTKGALVFGHYWTEDDLNKLRRLNSLAVDLLPPREELTIDTVTRVVDATAVEAESAFPSLSGAPAFVIRVRELRTFFAEAREMMNYISFATFLEVAILFFGLAFLLERFILRRVRRIAHALHLAENGGPMALDTSGRDEISWLARVVSALFSSVDHAQRELKKNYVKLRLLKNGERIARAHLTEALEDLDVGIAYYDADEFLVICNQAYRDLCPHGGETMYPGAAYGAILRSVYRHQRKPEDSEEEWIRIELARFRDPGPPCELLIRGKRVRVHDRRTRSGGIVSLRVDVDSMRRRDEVRSESDMGSAAPPA